MIKFIEVILTLFLFSSCLGPEKGVEQNKITGTAPNDSFHGGGSSASSSFEGDTSLLKSDIAFKNYAQYNMNLSKATGVSKVRVDEVYVKVKNSLPATTNPSLFNSFTLLAYTRLAFEYCHIFIDEAALFSSVDFAQIETTLLQETLIQHLLTEPPADKPGLYDALREQMQIIFNEEIQAGRNYANTIDENGDAISLADQKKNLTKMACTALLASNYFTTM